MEESKQTTIIKDIIGVIKNLGFLTFVNVYIGFYLLIVLFIQKDPNPTTLGRFLSKIFYSTFSMFQKVALFGPFVVAILTLAKENNFHSFSSGFFSFKMNQRSMQVLNSMIWSFTIFGFFLNLCSWTLQLNISTKESQSQIFDSGEVVPNNIANDNTFGNSRLTQFRYTLGVIVTASANGCYSVATLLACMYYYMFFFPSK